MDLDTPDQFNELNAVFTRWLTDSKSVVLNPNIALADFRESGCGRGVVALEDLQKDELVFSIPRTSVLSIENSSLYKLIPDELSELDQWLALILVLIHETRPSSPWKPYIDLLPRSFDSLMFWESSELAELQASAVLKKIGKGEAEKNFREKLWPIVQGHQGLFRDTDIAPDLAINAEQSLIDAAHRMGSVIMSYSFELESISQNHKPDPDSDEEEEDDDEYKAMVPMADMLNADAHLNNCRLFHHPETLEMKTLVPIPAGSQLYNDYGPLPRSDLLRRYGYVTSNYSTHDVVEISAESIIASVWTETPETEEDRVDRIDYLLDEEVLEDGYDIGTNFEIPEEVIVTLQTFLLPQVEFEMLKNIGKIPEPNKTKEVKEALVQILEGRLKEYGSSIEEDEEMLKGVIGGKRKRMALEVRLGEKKILVGTLEEVKGWAVGEGKRGGEEGPGGDEKRIRL